MIRRAERGRIESWVGRFAGFPKAAARWRLLRIWGLQKVSLDREISLQDPAIGPPEVRAALAFKKSSATFDPDLLLRYEIAYDRQFNRALKQLLTLQSNPAPKTSTPYHPDSLPGTTWEDPVEGEAYACEFAATSFSAERTQQSTDSTQPLHTVAPSEPSAGRTSFTQTFLHANVTLPMRQ